MKSFPPDIRFTCPACGGSAFGSVMDTDDPLGPMTRFCHGDDAGDGRAGCRFQWPSGDDWKHNLVEGRRLTEREFADVMTEIRNTPVAGFLPDAEA
jgi:hypothetical protein